MKRREKPSAEPYSPQHGALEAADPASQAGGPGAKALITRAEGPNGLVTVTGQGRAMAEALAAAGFTDTTVARRLGIGNATLRECRKRDPAVAEALARGRARMEDELVHGLMRQARDGYAPAAMFLLKTRCGYRETGATDGGDTKVNVQIVLPRALTMDEYMKTIENEPIPALPKPKVQP
jgi:hypothetical protein